MKMSKSFWNVSEIINTDDFFDHADIERILGQTLRYQREMEFYESRIFGDPVSYSIRQARDIVKNDRFVNSKVFDDAINLTIFMKQNNFINDQKLLIDNNLCTTFMIDSFSTFDYK